MIHFAIVPSPTPGFTNPNHISEELLRFFSFVNQMPMLTTLLVLMGLDIVSGLALSIYQKKLSSVISWRGMSRKVFMLLIVAMASLIEQFTGGIPVSKLASVCYIFTEAISILENAAIAGVPLPIALVTALTKMRESQKTVPVAVIKQDITLTTAELPATEAANKKDT
jgi:toxin secretion/phage lysis holin